MRHRLALLVLLLTGQPAGALAQATPSAPALLDLKSLQATPMGARATLNDGTPAELTIDVDLQSTAEQLLAQANPHKGALVAIEARTGKILVWSHYRRHGTPRYAEIATELIPSASLFKLVTTAALLERSPVTPHTQVCVSGGEHRIERRHLERPSASGAQCLPFSQALGFSVNAAYAQLVTQHLARADLAYFLERFGFNRALPFDAPAKLGQVSLPYSDLEFARTAAGFENTQLTVLGAAQLAYVVALEGQVPRMRLIERSGKYRAPDRVEILGRAMRTVTARRLARMMEVTVHSGTALESFTNPITGTSYLADLRVAGKTGTLPRAHRAGNTSWFTGFSPARAPQVIVVVMLENERVWHKKASDVARNMLRAYFSRHRGISHPLAALR